MCSTEIAFGVSQPGDPDYPLKNTAGPDGTIAEIHRRFNKDALYEDPDFPASDASIGKAKGDTAKGEAGKSAGKYVWRRPHEICKNWRVGKPIFAAAEGNEPLCSALDIRQGGLGDCWYLAGLATLTSNQEQVKIVVPEDNIAGFDDENYCGAFHFRLYSMWVGKYVDIVVDDRIPCNPEYYDQPAFCRPITSDEKGNEFWPVLIEKAFAKFRGSYRAIEGGGTATALELFTGGFSQWWNLNEYRTPEKYDVIAKKVKKYIEAKQYFGACAQGSKENAEKAGCLDGYTDLGLVCLHAYSVLGGAEVKEKDDPSKVHILLQLKNPWGSSEWKGRFSDGDDAGWATLEKDLRSQDASGSKKVDEGIFWMDLHDVIKYYSTLDYCLFGLEGGTQFSVIRSEWPADLQEKKISLTDRDSRQYAPAFSFEVKREIMEIPIPPEYEGKCVSVMRISAGKAGVHLDPTPKFMYYIYEVVDDMTLDQIYKNRKAVKYGGPNSWEFMNVLGIYLTPGRYFVTVVLQTDSDDVIPKAYVGKPIPFSLSLYTENKTCIEKIN